MSKCELVIFIDDDKDILDIYKAEMDLVYPETKAQYFSDALEVQKVLEETKQQILLITDGKIPDLNGYQLGKIVKAQNPDSVVIMISGHFNLEESADESRQVLNHFLEKPIDFDEFLALIKNYII